jgi:hypothetical protein
VKRYGERRLPHDKEHIMFALLSYLLGKLVSSDDMRSHSAYLASSGDLANLERRMRHVEEEDRAYSMSF